MDTSPAKAFVDDPTISPASPTPSIPISVHVRAGACHAFSDDVDEAELVVLGPGQLRLMTEGINLSPAHPFCIAPVFTYRFDIGTLPTGSYTLQLFIQDDFASPDPIAFGSVIFVVSERAMIPATSPISLLVLIALMCCIALWRNSVDGVLPRNHGRLKKG